MHTYTQTYTKTDIANTYIGHTDIYTNINTYTLVASTSNAILHTVDCDAGLQLLPRSSWNQPKQWKCHSFSKLKPAWLSLKKCCHPEAWRRVTGLDSVGRVLVSGTTSMKLADQVISHCIWCLLPGCVSAFGMRCRGIHVLMLPTTSSDSEQVGCTNHMVETFITYKRLDLAWTNAGSQNRTCSKMTLAASLVESPYWSHFKINNLPEELQTVWSTSCPSMYFGGFLGFLEVIVLSKSMVDIYHPWSLLSLLFTKHFHYDNVLWLKSASWLVTMASLGYYGLVTTAITGYHYQLLWLSTAIIITWLLWLGSYGCQQSNFYLTKPCLS